MLGLKCFLIPIAQKAWLEVCFFQTFSVGGWRGEGGKKVHCSKLVPAASGRLLKDLLALKAKFLCKSFSRTRLPENAVDVEDLDVSDLSGAVQCS